MKQNMTGRKKKHNGCNTTWLYRPYRKAVLLVQAYCTDSTKLFDDTKDVYDSEKKAEAVVISAVEEELSYVEEGDFVLS